jgi:hypothetical protein
VLDANLVHLTGIGLAFVGTQAGPINTESKVAHVESPPISAPAWLFRPGVNLPAPRFLPGRDCQAPAEIGCFCFLNRASDSAWDEFAEVESNGHGLPRS